jgi:hypothetical protein
MEQKMSSKQPSAKWKVKGYEIVQWANSYGYTYNIIRNYKNKKTDAWEKQQISVFWDGLLTLKELIDQAIQSGDPANAEKAQVQATEYIKHEVKSFDDDDLPF